RVVGVDVELGAAEVRFGHLVTGGDVQAADERVVSRAVVLQLDAEAGVEVVVAAHVRTNGDFVGVDGVALAVDGLAVDGDLVEPAAESEAGEQVGRGVDAVGDGGVAG